MWVIHAEELSTKKCDAIYLTLWLVFVCGIKLEIFPYSAGLFNIHVANWIWCSSVISNKRTHETSRFYEGSPVPWVPHSFSCHKLFPQTSCFQSLLHMKKASAVTESVAPPTPPSLHWRNLWKWRGCSMHGYNPYDLECWLCGVLNSVGSLHECSRVISTYICPSTQRW